MSGIGIQDRTKEAFQELVLSELPGLYSLARRLVRDGAEDLVQETLPQGYRTFGDLKADAAGGRWLKTILVNIFRDQLRKRARSIEEVATGDLEDFSLYRTLIDVGPLPYSDSVHTHFLEAFGRDELREVLLPMPEICRAPLVLRYMDGFSTKEIARMLDAPLGTIPARLHPEEPGARRDLPGAPPRRTALPRGPHGRGRAPARDRQRPERLGRVSGRRAGGACLRREARESGIHGRVGRWASAHGDR